MLTPNDIADRLEVLIRERFSEEDVHRELCPQGFKRPCNLIVLDKCELEPGMAPALVGVRPTFTLTTFVEVDEYHHSHQAALHLRQTALASLFLPGYIKVAGRAPKVENLAMDGGYDFDTVTVKLFYAVDRSEFMELEQAPEAKQMVFRLTVNDTNIKKE